MEQAQLNWIGIFIWDIAEVVLRELDPVTRGETEGLLAEIIERASV